MPANIRDDAFIEQLARSIHADYVAKSQARGETEAENRSMVSWEQLPRDLQDANVAQAAGIGAKLEAINAVVVPESAEASDFSFTQGPRLKAGSGLTKSIHDFSPLSHEGSTRFFFFFCSSIHHMRAPPVPTRGDARRFAFVRTG